MRIGDLSSDVCSADLELTLQYAIPPTGSLLTTLRIVAPAVAEHGSTELKDDVLARLQRCDLIGCQLFSEPEAGSDLANVRTRALRAGEPRAVSGQKTGTPPGPLTARAHGRTACRE